MNNNALADKPNLCVFIGRFEPFHIGHERVVREGLERAERMVVFVGSANEARSFRNPFNAAERIKMIKDTFGDDPRLIVLPLEDSNYDINEWVERTYATVDGIWAQITTQNPDAPQQPSVALIGHDKDATSYYLGLFPKWSFIDVPQHAMLSATTIREAYFGTIQIAFDLLDEQNEAAKAVRNAKPAPRNHMVQARQYLFHQHCAERDVKAHLSAEENAFFSNQLDILDRRTVAGIDEPLDLEALFAWLHRFDRAGVTLVPYEGQGDFLNDLAALDPGFAALWEPIRPKNTITRAQLREQADFSFAFNYRAQAQKAAYAFLKRQRALQDTGHEVLGVAVIDFLEEFLHTSHYMGVSEEYANVGKSKYDWRHAPYPPLFVTADALVLHEGHILLLKRKRYPGKGLWALPGGFVEENEPTQVSALRELEEETSIGLDAATLASFIELKEVFDAPYRSSRGRTITHAYLIALPDGPRPTIKTGGLAGDEETFDIQWLAIEDLKRDKFFEDHYSIIIKLMRLLKAQRRMA